MCLAAGIKASAARALHTVDVSQPTHHPEHLFSPWHRNKEDVEDVRREVQILHHLGGNPNITLLKGAYEDKYNVHLVMELCSGGELFDRIVSRGHYR